MSHSRKTGGAALRPTRPPCPSLSVHHSKSFHHLPDSSRQDGAAGNGNAECVEALLDAGAGLDARFRENGRAALAIAADEGWIDVVELLVDAGANIHARDDRGDTPLSLAARRGYREIVDLLQAAGAR